MLMGWFRVYGDKYHPFLTIKMIALTPLSSFSQTVLYLFNMNNRNFWLSAKWITKGSFLIFSPFLLGRDQLRGTLLYTSTEVHNIVFAMPMNKLP